MAGRGRWLEKITGGRYKRLAFEAKTATAVRAVIADGDRTGFPHIEIKMVMRTPSEDKRSGEQIDELVVYMELADASKLTQHLISAVQAATPRIPGPAYRVPFE